MKKCLSLIVGVTAIALVWLVLLPQAAQRPPMKSHLRWLDEQGIDPSAMYYTELPVMEEIIARREQRPDAQTKMSSITLP